MNNNQPGVGRPIWRQPHEPEETPRAGNTGKTRGRELIVELERLLRPAEVVQLDEARLKSDLRNQITDAKGLLRRQRAQAGQMLRKLRDQPFVCEVFEDQGRKG